MRLAIHFLVSAAACVVLALVPSAAGAATTGELTQLAGFPGCIADTPSGPDGGCFDGTALTNATHVAVSPDGKNVYATAPGADAVAIFDRDPLTGGLTQKLGTAGCVSETGSGGACQDGVALDGAEGIAVSQDGAQVYVASSTSNAIAVFDRDLSTGALTQKSGADGCIAEAATGATAACAQGTALSGARAIAISSDGTSLYVASTVSDGIAILDRNTTSGVLTQKPSTAGCYTDNGNDGATTGACEDGFLLTQPRGIAVSPDGLSVYVAAAASDAIAVFDRNTLNGALAQKPTPAACATDTGSAGNCLDAAGIGSPRSVAVSPDGHNVYVASFYGGGDGALAILDRGADGTLAAKSGLLGCFRVAADPACTQLNSVVGAFDVAVSPDDLSVYVASDQNSGLAIFDRDPNNGTVLNKPGPAGCINEGGSGGCASGVGLGATRGVAVSPDGGNVYAAGSVPGAVAAFKREAVPRCNDVSRTAFYQTPRSIPLDCSDANHDALTYSIVSPPSNGTLGAIDQSDGTVTYTPNAGFSGSDSFTYRATSAGTDSNVATVSLEVLPPQPTTSGSGGAGGSGASGGPIVVTRFQLFVGLLADKLTARAHRPFSVRYLSTLAGQATLKIKKRSKTVATSRGRAVKGKNKIRVSRKAAKKLGRGKYSAVLTVVSSDGQMASDSARLTVR